MRSKFQKSMIAAGVAAALGVPGMAMANPGINFDATGGAFGNSEVDGAQRFNWTNQSVLAKGLFDETVGNTLNGTLLGHGSLDSVAVGATSIGVGGATGILHGGSITYQYSVNVSGSINDGKGGAANTVTFGDQGNYGASNFFNIYYDPTPTVNLASGAGFGLANGETNSGQILILSGKITLNAANGNNFTASGSTHTPSSPLDASGTDDSGTGAWSIAGSGSLNFNINVCQPGEASADCAAVPLGNVINTDFFLSDVSSFSLDVDLNGGIQSIFKQFRPPQKVLNTAPSFGNSETFSVDNPLTAAADAVSRTRRVNDFDCGGSATACDMLYQGQNGLSSWNHETPAPEPNTLALMGLAIGGAGFLSRRKLKKG